MSWVNVICVTETMVGVLQKTIIQKLINIFSA